MLLLSLSGSHSPAGDPDVAACLAQAGVRCYLVLSRSLSKQGLLSPAALSAELRIPNGEAQGIDRAVFTREGK